SRLAFADRGMYMADQDYVPMPTQRLVNTDYLQERAQIITAAKALASAPSGTPPWDDAMQRNQDISIDLPSTS
ncbi:gamma-glutamyltransferase, partial [Vibrio echinoideorum]